MPKEELSPFGTLIRETDNDDSDTRFKTIKRQKTKTAMDDKDDAQEENGVWFWVNKSGFPIDDKTWERMWDHVAKIHPSKYSVVHKIRGHSDLPQVPYPTPPLNCSPTLAIPDRLEKIQNYMNSLQYNHTGTQFFEIRKNRPISGLMECAKDMIKESLPIKCLEAIILGVFLTNGMLGVERFPLSFKTAFNGNIHRHVVLGIYYSGRYGALGMSRREDLMYKPLIYKSLAELVCDYEKCYKKYWHDVKKVKIGLPVSHDPHSYEFIQWKTLILNRPKLSEREFIKEIDQHARDIRGKRRLIRTSSVYESRPVRTVAKELDPSSQIVALSPPMPMPMYCTGRKARSWITPQSQSPRKSLSFIDLDSIRHSSKTSTTTTSLSQSVAQAMKTYQGTSGSNKMEAKLPNKRENTDLADYQIRI